MGQLLNKCFKPTVVPSAEEEEAVNLPVPIDDSTVPVATLPETTQVQREPTQVATQSNMAPPEDFPYEFLYDEVANVGTTVDLEYLRADVLGTFECPFRAPCAMAFSCPFGHAAPTGILRSVPPYFCLDALLGNCRRGSADELSRCSLGFHPTIEDLTDLDTFNQKLASVILLGDPSPHTPSRTPAKPMIEWIPPEEFDDSKVPSCPICLDALPPSGTQLGYLENCAHIFHGACLLDWKEQRASQNLASDCFDCPECRLESGRILLWPALFSSETEKRTAFYLQKSCFGLQVDSDITLSVHQLGDGHFAVIIDGQNFIVKTEAPSKELAEGPFETDV